MIRSSLVVAGALAAPMTLLGLLTPAVAHAGSGQFVRTQSGEIVCDVLFQEVYCEYPPGFLNAPLDPNTGRPFNLAVVRTSGDLRWKTGEINAWPQGEIGMQDGHAYHMFGWNLVASPEGTRFTSDFTAHGMFVNIDGAQPF
ncbi:MAG TPA: hypothetical protein VFR17_09040 [Mycobacterium sp.]|nr:hypothetical protein [Mycobacterium sp.]